MKERDNMDENPAKLHFGSLPLGKRLQISFRV
jgi:hypothetical protein